MPAAPLRPRRSAGAEQLSTTEPGISLLDGYATLFDMQRARCVESDGDAPIVGQPTSSTTIQQVKDDTELAKELGLDATLSVKAPTASGGASASMLHTFKSTSNTITFLIRIVHQYVATQRGQATLTAEAARWLRDDPKEFLHRCGDRFVGSITYEAGPIGKRIDL